MEPPLCKSLMDHHFFCWESFRYSISKVAHGDQGGDGGHITDRTTQPLLRKQGQKDRKQRGDGVKVVTYAPQTSAWEPFAS